MLNDCEDGETLPFVEADYEHPNDDTTNQDVLTSDSTCKMKVNELKDELKKT